MAVRSTQIVVRHLRELTSASAVRALTDLQLLARFTTDQSEEAFGELVRRHGQVVLGVCRRVLGNEQDAEDVFQAAFLVLARKAGTIRKGASVGSFLHGVAYRIAMKERTRLFRQRQRERRVERPVPTGPVHEAALRELQVMLDEGLNRLPEKYRIPFVLCCLEGKSKGEAARELGWKEGTVSSRLAHARELLRALLARKGIALTAALTTVGITAGAGEARASACLVSSCARTACHYVAGSLTSSRAAELAGTALRGTGLVPWRVSSALLLVACLAVGGSRIAHQTASPATSQDKPAKPATATDEPRTDRQGDPLPPGALARLGTTRWRQGFFTRNVGFSPDGKTVICAAVGHGLCLWDANTGKEIREFEHTRYGMSAVFSPDGERVAASFEKIGPGIYETATGRMIAKLPPGIGTIPNTLAYAPDGKILAGAEGETAILLLDPSTGQKRTQQVACGPEQLRCLAWSPDSKLLAWGAESGTLHLWDVNQAAEAGRWKAYEKPVSNLAFTRDGRTLATTSLEPGISLWDVATHKKQQVLDTQGPYVKGLAFSRDGHTLASGQGDGTIAVWDLQSSKMLRRWQAHAFAVGSLDFSPDGNTLVSGAVWESGPRLWDVRTGKEVHPVAGHHAPVDELSFAADGRALRSLGRDRAFLRWDPAAGSAAVELTRPEWRLDACKVSPGGDTLATWGYRDDSIHLWDLTTGKERHNLGTFGNKEKESGRASNLAFTPDGRLLASGIASWNAVLVWEVASGKLVRRCEGLGGPVLALAFTPDGKQLAGGTVSLTGDHRTIRIWNIGDGSATELPSKGRVTSLAFSPDGKLLASGAWLEEPPRLWDVAAGRELHHLATQPLLYDLTFSPDGRWLAGAGADNDQKVHVWEVGTGIEVYCFVGHLGCVMSAAFSPDSHTLATGGGDSSILLWDLTGRQRDGRLQPTRLTPEELEQRWRDLAGVDGPRMVRAIYDLTASPDQAVVLLRQRLQRVEPVDAARVERLVRDLDAEDFDMRAKAQAELDKIAEGAEPLLRKKLAEGPPAEARRYLTELLEKLEPVGSAERSRVLRGIQVLEYVGTPEARAVLRTLASGVEGAQVTREARRSLRRLEGEKP